MISEEQLRSIIAQAVQTVVAETEADAKPAPAAAPKPAAASQPEEQPKGPLPTSAERPGISMVEQKMKITDIGTFTKGTNPKEVVVAISPNFYRNQKATIVGLPHEEVLREIVAGIEEEGLTYRFMRVLNTADVAFIAHNAAKGSGSGIGVGVIARGTTVIHQRDLAPLSNLELFPQSPLLDAETFRAIGKNSARYAKGESPDPVPVRNDQMARPKYQAIAALMHNKETQLVDLHARNVELRVDFG